MTGKQSGPRRASGSAHLLPPVRFRMGKDGLDRLFYAASDRDRSRGWLEVPIADGWKAKLELIPQDGFPVVASAFIFHAEFEERKRPSSLPPRGLSSSLLRKLPFETLLSETRGLIRYLREQWGLRSFEEGKPLQGFDRILREEPARPGKKGHPELFYATMAAEYIALMERGSRRPVRELAERHGMQPAGMRALLHRARQRGLLTTGAIGRPGGELTAKALALLKNDP